MAYIDRDSTDIRSIDHRLEFDDCACMHGIDCYDYELTCVYCGHKISVDDYKKRFVND